MKDNSSIMMSHGYRPSETHKHGKNKLSIDSSSIHLQQNQDAVLNSFMSQYS